MRSWIGGWTLLAAAAASWASQDPQAQPLQDAQRVAWRPASGEVWVLCAGGTQVRVFDAFLRERDRAPEPDAFPDGGGREVQVWAGRTLMLDPEAGTLSLQAAAWERAPELVWGPGWGLVEARSTWPMEALEWRRAGDAEVHRARFASQLRDGLVRRAWIEDVAPGERLEVRLPAPPAFPPREWDAWIPVTVPEVDPAGERPRRPLR